MPNGGYPLHFTARIDETDFGLAVSGSDLTLAKFVAPSVADTPRLRFKPELIGRLTPSQIRGLLFHLQYWGGGTRDDAHGKPRGLFGGQRIEPEFDAANCSYDY